MLKVASAIGTKDGEGMAASRYSFDVQVRCGDRWIIEAVRHNEADARALAAGIFADSKCAGTRIVRNWTRPDGNLIETELFRETREVRDDGALRIVAVDSVPARCETLKDCFAADSRQVMTRIFRDYLNEIVITPTELMHDFKELRRIQEKDSLVRSAIDRVASLQTRENEGNARVRRDQLFQLLDQMSDRARKVNRAGLPRLGDKFSETMGAIGREADQDERDYLALVVLSQDLLDLRNWVGKLELLCRLAAVEDEPHAARMLDGVIADVLGTDVMQEILGRQSSLAGTICELLDLAEGMFATGKTAAGESAHQLNRLLADRRLPASRRCIIDRAHRSLRAARPLHPRDGSKEHDEFRKVVERLLTPTGLHSGAETAASLTARFARMVEQGGKPGRRAAIGGVFWAMPDRASGVLYLCDLARSDYANEHLDDMIGLFDMVYPADTMAGFCHRALPPKDRMARATGAYHAVTSSEYPAEIRQRMAGHIDGVLERYVIEENIVERLDRPDIHLRDRARLLVQFCGSGVLPEGKALARARARTLALLRQPDFSARFVDGLADPVLAERSLRDFYALLNSKGGFGGATQVA